MRGWGKPSGGRGGSGSAGSRTLQTHLVVISGKQKLYSAKSKFLQGAVNKIIEI